MVRIIGFKENQKEDESSFFVLEIQGGIEMVKSNTTGRFYATAQKAYISSTFDEQTCIALIGTEMSGDIVKEECEPYNYVIKETGEEIVMSHRWVFHPESKVEKKISKQEIPESLLNVQNDKFSQNGALNYA